MLIEFHPESDDWPDKHLSNAQEKAEVAESVF